MSSISLFDKYGGFSSLYPLVGAFYDEVLNSDVVSHMFDSTDMAQLIEHQTKFIAAVMGGPGTYDDKLLESSHKRLNITEDEWNEVVNILINTLTDFDIEEGDIDTLISKIGAKKHLIVKGN